MFSISVLFYITEGQPVLVIFCMDVSERLLTYQGVVLLCIYTKYVANHVDDDLIPPVWMHTPG